ncbi:helix-turn-helix domain-containing protein [Methylobacterium indicum]|uniref:XRE family transcriptional regulator n=1 Tax=Methylobacterium indicum TaxID=1775910 RepID=A0ABR5GTA0_9HYPH|nr:helix-turn-helix domain-containing protein [Methylobacterium indicum]KMO12591.1 XRE family transcriptional regulator [Methylobacterium indicum]KMO23742.1 XRE family transcriptional regulator [Methylobacterium indicum]
MRAALATNTVGDVLRDWRRRRRFSQLDLALEAEISARHLSFVENGRSAASRDMLLRLAERLALPLRERNRLLVAGGYAPVFAERPLEQPDMRAALDAVRAVLAAYEPFPALAVDRHWTLVAANDALTPLLAGVAPRLLRPPVNVLALSLSPEGLAPAILNLGEWRRHILERLRRDAATSGDPELDRLHDALQALPAPGGRSQAVHPSDADRIAVPLVLRHPATGRQLSFLSTTTVFGTATDVALSELTLEGFLPADEATRRALTGPSS